jgi:hypothetical protein
MKVRVRERVK